MAFTYYSDSVEVSLEDFTNLLSPLFNSSPDCICKIGKMDVNNEENSFSATLKVEGNLNDLRAIALVRKLTCLGGYDK